MTTTQTDRLLGVTTSLALKAPVKAATTANITLSGEQTIDGIALVEGDRVLVKDQTNAVENGIWDVAVSSWSRSKDFDGDRDVVTGTRVYIASGTTYEGYEACVTTTGDITIGTSSIAFSMITVIDGTISAALETVSDNIADVNTCADNIAAIIAAPAEATAAASSADEAEYWAGIAAGGGITSITAGDGISVDDSTPTEPIVSADVQIDAAQTFSGGQRTAASALTSTSNHIAVDLALNNDFTHTLTEDTTLDNPTNIVAGQKGRITITQAASAKTLAYGSYWDFPSGTVPTVSTGSGEIDVLYYDVLTTTKIACNLVKDIS